MKMQAAIFRGPNQPLTVETVDVDEPHPGEVLVRSAAVGVCHSDLHYVDGTRSLDAPAAILGHEPAGIVEAVGPGVTTVEPGDHVIACTSLYCGTCAQCLQGRPHLCTGRETCRRPADAPPRLSLEGRALHQFVDLGAFAERLLVHERALVRIDADIPLDRAALIGCSVTTGVGAALNAAEVRPGSTVAVFGAGGVGISVIQGARLAGARQIIAVDLLGSKLEHALHFGATATINSSNENPVGAIKRLSNGGVDYSFEAVGNAKLVEQCLYCLAPRGLATLVGAVPPGDRVSLNAGHFFLEKRMQGCYMGSNRFQLDAPKYLDFYRQKRLNLDDMVTRRARLDEINDAFRAMVAGEVIRTVIVFDT